MSNFSANAPYKFIKVEDYFCDYQKWEKLEKVKDASFDQTSQTLSLNFTKADGNVCTAVIQFIQKDTFRLRFNPSKKSFQEYTTQNTRSVVMDSFEDLQEVLKTEASFTVDTEAKSGQIVLTTRGDDNHPSFKMVVMFDPFVIEVFSISTEKEFRVWQTGTPSIYYTPNGADDYSIIQAVNKPATAKYIGFGEQGGQGLTKNTAQLNYFNFDNMRYRQVYNRGP
jgi:alpha-glucosidase